MKRDWALLLIAVGILTAARLWLASHWTVTPDESFYWLCAQRMDLAFFDDPWGTAWLVHWGTSLAGDGSLGLRLFFPIFAAIATVAVWGLGRKLAGPSAGWWVAALLNAAPGFQVLAVEASSSGPAFACALAGLALIAIAPGSVGLCALAGVSFALALQFSMWPWVAVVAAVGFAIRASRKTGSVASWIGLAAAVVIALAGMLPFLMWNQLHDWPLRALGTWQTFTAFSGASLLAAFSQAAYQISWPAVFVVGLGFLYTLIVWRKTITLRRPVLIAAPFLLAWLYVALIGQANPFLVLGGFVGILIAAGAATPAWLHAGVGVVIATGMSLTFYLQAISRPADLPWASIRKSVESLMEAGGPYVEGPFFVIAQSARLTASLNYHLAQSQTAAGVEVFLLESQNLANQFGLWPAYDDFVETEVAPDEFFEELQAENPYMGRSAFYLTREPEAALPQAITAAFEEVLPAAAIALGSGGTLYIYFCRNYQTLPL